MRKPLCVAVLVFGILMLASTTSAQVSTGVPPLGSFSSGPDVINLGNLNANFRFPVIHKPGRGMPFDFILSYDTSVWTKATINGVTSWQPTGNWGWRTLTEANVGYISFRSTEVQCQIVIDTVPPRYRTVTELRRDQYQYHDMFGTIHNFSNATGGCSEDLQTNDSVSTDTSGYTLHTGVLSGGSITAPDGTIINPPVGGSTGGANRVDRNGNEITTNGSSFTDTLGATVLTSSGGVPNPLILTYTTTSGTQASVTVTYALYTVQTSFGCSGVADYPATSTSLVSSISYPDGSSFLFAYEPTPGNGNNVTGRLASISLRTGGKINYTYTGPNNGIICADGSTAGLTRTLTHGTTTDTTTTYARSNPSGAAWTTTVTDGTGNQEVINFQSSGTPIANFYETRRSIYQGVATGTPLLQIDTCYNSGTPDCSLTAVSLPITEIKRYTTANGLKDSYSDTVLGSFGLPARIDEYDYRPSPAVLLRRTFIGYAALGNGIVGMPSTVTVQDGSGHQVAQTTYGYDNPAATPTSGVPQHVAVSGSRGNLTSISRWLNTTGANLVTTMTYDDTGNLLTSTDPGGHQTQFSYADNFTDGLNHGTLAYLSEVTMPDTNSPNLAHHVTLTEYDFNTGLVMASTDQNLKSTLYTYDSMLRPVNTELPDGGLTTISYPSTTQTVVYQKIDDARSTEARTVLDSFGRVSRTVVANGETTPYDLTDFCYDSNGRLSFQSYTYQASSYTGANVCSGAGDSFTYDGLGRRTQVAHSDATHATTTYNGRAQQITDEGNGTYSVSRVLQSDALGRLSSVCEVSSVTLLGSGGTPFGCGLDITATGFLTSYGYDLLGNLTSVTQGSLINRSFSYDSLSRLTSESHPEWGSGSQTTYEYNSDSLLISRTRPAPNQTNPAVTVITNYGYDALHRLTSRSYSGDTTGTPYTGFSYDEPTAWSQMLSNTTGRLSSEFSGSTGQIFGYDPMGRATINWQCTPRVCGTTAYLLSYTYDLAGDLTSASNGVGVTFHYSYNTAPRLTSMTSNLVDAQHPATLLNNVHYGPFGVVSDTLGNGLNESIGYSTRGLLKSYSSTPYSFTLTGLAGNGSVTAGNDSANGNWTYTYDQFNRLASSNKSTSPVQGFSYAYDRYANRWQQNVTAGSGPQPQYLMDNATNRISGSGITYDALGNMLTDGLGSTYTWDAENRLIKVVNSGGTYNYTYDAEGRRVKNASTEFLYDLADRPVTLLIATTGGWAYGEIYAGGRHFATYSGATTNFLHSDWLGTKRVMTSITGTPSQTCTSLPFGDGPTCTGTEWDFNHFTDDIHDGEDNLEHTWFRQLSSTQGRFTTTDPFSGSMDLSNPQTLNRYAYAMNDPMDYADPTGLDAADGTGTNPSGGPFANNVCTLMDGGPNEIFACADFSNSFTTGSGLSFGLSGPGFGGLGGGFGGVPLPGCLLPGACNVQLPSLSQQINQWLAGVLPNSDCTSVTVITENCTPASDLQSTGTIATACAAQPEACAAAALGMVAIAAAIYVAANTPTFCTTGNCLDKWPWVNNDCDDQYEADSQVCRKRQTSSCWASAAQRLAACYRGKPIPPLSQ